MYRTKTNGIRLLLTHYIQLYSLLVGLINQKIENEQAGREVALNTTYN